jgi:hypothetical protein
MPKPALRLVSFLVNFKSFQAFWLYALCVLTQLFFIAAFVFHADLAFAEASRAFFQRQHPRFTASATSFRLTVPLSELSKSRT